jgi:hypothetical protein
MEQEKTPVPASRRHFLRTTALASAASFFIVPRHVLGKGYTAPSDKLNIAGVGVAGKGFSDVNNAFNQGANNIVALCDVDWNHARDQFARHPMQKSTKTSGRCWIRKPKILMP